MKHHYKDLEQYKTLHKKSIYGDSGHIYTNNVVDFVKEVSPNSILDFGCGVGKLKTALKTHNIDVDEFDPCVAGKGVINRSQYDLVITTDVLEHIYQDELYNFFEEILALKPKFMYHAISTRTAVHLLPDGTNCHKTIKDGEWWAAKIMEITDYGVALDLFSKDTVVIKAYQVV